MADVWANLMACHPRATCHITGCCHLANSMSWATCHIAGCCHLVNSLSWFQSHMPHCRVQSPGEINVVIVPHCILKIVFRHILFFLFSFNAVWALTSGGFLIVSVTLVWCVNFYGFSVRSLGLLIFVGFRWIPSTSANLLGLSVFWVSL